MVSRFVGLLFCIATTFSSIAEARIVPYYCKIDNLYPHRIDFITVDSIHKDSARIQYNGFVRPATFPMTKTKDGIKLHGPEHEIYINTKTNLGYFKYLASNASFEIVCEAQAQIGR